MAAFNGKIESGKIVCEWPAGGAAGASSFVPAGMRQFLKDDFFAHAARHGVPSAVDRLAGGFKEACDLICAARREAEEARRRNDALRARLDELAAKGADAERARDGWRKQYQEAERVNDRMNVQAKEIYDALGLWAGDGATKFDVIVSGIANLRSSLAAAGAELKEAKAKAEEAKANGLRLIDALGERLQWDGKPDTLPDAVVAAVETLKAAGDSRWGTRGEREEREKYDRLLRMAAEALGEWMPSKKPELAGESTESTYKRVLRGIGELRDAVDAVRWEPSGDDGPQAADEFAPPADVPDGGAKEAAGPGDDKDVTPLSQCDGRFADVLLELARLNARKAADYGKDEDAFANIRASERFGVPAWLGAVLRGNDKVARLSAYAVKGVLANEGVEDSLADLAAYAVIALILFREHQAHENKKEAA